MAKNKNNRKQGDARGRSSAAEEARAEARTSATEGREGFQSQAQGSPADVARKHQRRFGHN
ncbi:hypothetical protein [Streptomyces sp. NPDC007088]|uniref:hypothetical protein n=1 Tax=Streptomyces sp. NPDC007088 TaxID=3364773 RepID=UPI003674BB1E